MYKSYGKSIGNKLRKRQYNYYRKHDRLKSSRERSLYKKILAQLLISIIIISLIILLKSINITPAQKVSVFLRESIFAEYNYKKGVEKVINYAKNIKNHTIQSIPVFENNESSIFSIPLEGVVVSNYGEKYDPITEKSTFQKGIDIKVTDNGIVKSIQEGSVELIGQSETYGKFIKIRHSKDMFSIYGNLDKIFVKEGQNILNGERIGEILNIDNRLFHFELWIDESPVDPQDYIEYSNKSI